MSSQIEDIFSQASTDILSTHQQSFISNTIPSQHLKTSRQYSQKNTKYNKSSSNFNQFQMLQRPLTSNTRFSTNTLRNTEFLETLKTNNSVNPTKGKITSNNLRFINKNQTYDPQSFNSLSRLKNINGILSKNKQCNTVRTLLKTEQTSQFNNSSKFYKNFETEISVMDHQKDLLDVQRARKKQEKNSRLTNAKDKKKLEFYIFLKQNMNQVYEGNSFINLKESQQQQNNKSALKNETHQNQSHSHQSSSLFQKLNNNNIKSVQFQQINKNQLLKQENQENLNQKNILQQKRPKTAFELKKDFVQQLFQDQKAAVSSYLKGNKLDKFFIEHDSELSKGPSQVVEFMQREFLRINKEAPQILKKHKPSEKSSEEIKHELLKQKRHQFLKDFINKEQEYFDILEKLQTQGTQNFQKSLSLQQKFNFQTFFEPQTYTDKINEKPIIPEELERMDQYKKEKEQAKFLYFQQQFKEKYKKQLEELKVYEENLQEKQKQKQLNNYFLKIKDSDIKIDNQGNENQAQNSNNPQNIQQDNKQEQIQEEEQNINMLAMRDIKKNSYNFEAFELQKQSQYKEENPQEYLKYYFLTKEDLKTQKHVSLINEKMDIYFKDQQYIEAIKQQKSKKVLQKMMSHRQNSSFYSQEQSPKQKQNYFDQNQYNMNDRILYKRRNKDCIQEQSNSNKGQFSNQNRSLSTSPKKLNKNQCQNFSENVQNLEKLNSLKKQQEQESPGKKRNETENSKDLIVFQNKQKKKQKYCKEFDYEGQHIKQKGENVPILRIKHKKKIEIKNEPLQSGIQKVKNAIRKLKAVDFILNFELEKQQITQKDINNCIQELDIKRTNLNLLKKIEEINYLNQQTKQYKDQFPKQLTVEQINFFKLIKNQNSDISLIVKVLQLNKNWVNLVDLQNLTPLHWAVKRGNLDLVKILIQFGANPLVLDSADRVPKEIAVKYGFREIYKYLNKLEKLEKQKLQQK